MSRYELNDYRVFHDVIDLAVVCDYETRILLGAELAAPDAGPKFVPSETVLSTGGESLAAADFDLDGYVDLAVSNYTGSNVTVYLNDGSGTFSMAHELPTLRPCTGLVTGYFNSDEYPDIAVAADDSIKVFLGGENGTFSEPTNYRSGERSIYAGGLALADFDGNGVVDFAAINEQENRYPGMPNLKGPELEVFFGVGDGTFHLASAVDITPDTQQGYYKTGCLAVGLVNDDEKPDIAVAKYVDNAVSVVLNHSTPCYLVDVTVFPKGDDETEAGGEVSGDGFYSEGDLVILEAVPGFRYEFVDWTENGAPVADAGNPYTFTMGDTHRYLVANFRETYPVYVFANPDQGGTAEGQNDYAVGSMVTVTATPNEGWAFVNWTNAAGAEVSQNAEYTFEMPENYVQLYANFSQAGYEVTVSASPTLGGAARVIDYYDGDNVFALGDGVVIEAEPNEGYRFVNWTEGTGSEVFSIFAKHNFSMPSHALDLVANFEVMVSRTLTLTANLVEGGAVTGAGTFYQGTSVTVTATTNPGYRFVYWEDDAGYWVSSGTNYTFSMPDSDLNLVAHFEAVQIQPTWTKSAMLKVVEKTSNSVTVRLTKPAVGATEYVVYVNGEVYGTVNAEDTDLTFFITDLEPGASYTISVEGANNGLTTDKNPVTKVKTDKVKPEKKLKN